MPAPDLSPAPTGGAASVAAGDLAPTAREVVLLHELVAIPSFSGRERPAVDFLCRALGELGFVATVDEVGNAVGTLGDGPREIVLLGHIDTVPGAIPVRVEGGVLHGRGAVDAKGALATFVCAAARARPAGLRVVVIGAVGEEAESPGAHHVAPRYRPDLCVIGEPSGWDSVVLGYKGSLAARYTLRQPGGHSAGPLAGAPQRAVDFWNRVARHADAFNRGREAAFARLEPTLRAFGSADDGLYERAELRLNFRLPLDLDGAALASTLADLARTDLPDGAEAAVETATPTPAFRADKNSALVRALLPAIRAAGGRPRFKVKTGTADMNIVGPAWGCPIVAYGPGDASLDHTPHERLALADYGRAIAVLASALVTLGAGPEGGG
jgi:LysW-gamma-L-lysine carboxypeptidase